MEVKTEEHQIDTEAWKCEHINNNNKFIGQIRDSMRNAFKQEIHVENADRQKIHTSNTTFQCSYCEKSFTQRSHLISHQKTHTDEKHILMRKVWFSEGFKSIPNKL